MQTFREWLNEKENIKYFTELKLIEKEIQQINSHNDNLIKLDLFVCEAVIEPEKIKIKTYNEKDLNEEFKKYNIMFIYKYHINLNGHYDKKKDLITIYYSDLDKFSEIEALVGHEMVHKIQHKHSNKYFSQSQKIVNQINANEKKLIELFDANTKESMKEWNKLRIKNIKIYNDYLHNTVYEKMAYAYQEVKNNTSGNITDIIKKLERNGFIVDNKLRKYIGMYWLIRDKI